MLKNGEFSNPHLAAEWKAKLAGEFSFLMGRLEEILKNKPKWWNENREKHKSDNQCEKAWEQTLEGIDEMGLKLRTKRIAVLISALNTLIRICEMEVKNLL